MCQRRTKVSALGSAAALVLLLLAAGGGRPAAAQETRVDGMRGNAHAGAAAYRRYCIGCHGPAGDGNGENAQWIEPKPRDFTAATFKCRSTPTGALPTDEDLYHSVSRGFVTTNMPPWLPLPRQTRVDLVAYIKTFSPRWASPGARTPLAIPPETPVTVESILRGRALFQKMDCWKCHGTTGHGDGPSASSLTDSKDNPIRPYNFSTGTRFKCGETNQDLYRIFMTGVDGTPMPSFADNLRPAEAWDLVHFLRTMQRLPTPEARLWQAWLPAHARELPPLGPDQSGQ
ncbi:MAG TPA: cytochrome c [Gemmatimonadales bacterium]|nr:cytochrome c [Gemmatimonadales bacterium]